MKKRITLLLLSALLLTNVTACNLAPETNNESTLEDANTTKSTIEEPKKKTDEESQIEWKKIDITDTNLYADLLQSFQSAIACQIEGRNLDSKMVYVSALNEVAINGLMHTDPFGFGYALKDLNDDETPELILLARDYCIFAIYTCLNGQPVLLDRYLVQNHSCAIDSDRRIYKTGYGKGENGYHLIQEYSNDGTLTTLLQYGTYDENIDDLDIEYYKIADGERSVITKEEYLELVELYSPYFSNLKEITKKSDTTFSPLFESVETAQ